LTSVKELKLFFIQKNNKRKDPICALKVRLFIIVVSRVPVVVISAITIKK